MALILLVMFVSLSMALTTTSHLELRKSQNGFGVFAARANAETGLRFMVQAMNEAVLSPDTGADNVLSEVASHLSDRLDGSGNLGAASVLVSDGVLTVPQIVLPNGGFLAHMTAQTSGDDLLVTLTVTGLYEQIRRSASITYVLEYYRSGIFDYGIASRGRVTVQGEVTGQTNPADARILSTRESTPAIQVYGGGVVGGEIHTTGASSDYISLGTTGIGDGQFSVGGLTDMDAIMNEQVQLGVPEPPFPEIDVSPFAAMAVNPLSSGVVVDKQLVLENVRIPAGTNPTIDGKVLLRGVLYIESPNRVTFAGSAVVEGVIVTETPTHQDLYNNTLSFEGGFSVPGVDALPASDPKWTDLREMGGSAVLAPGFALSFSGNSHTVNGVIAADKVSFAGNTSVGGSQEGAILGLQDYEMAIGGSSGIRVELIPSDELPSGFRHHRTLLLQSGSYTEVAP